MTTQLPRISFGIIVLNGEPFTRYCLRSLYSFAFEIIVVEGASKQAAEISTPDGHSLDTTLESLHSFQSREDPEKKSRLLLKMDSGAKRMNNLRPMHQKQRVITYGKLILMNFIIPKIWNLS